MGDGYFYPPDETPKLEYQVQVEPPPADEAKARLHKHTPTGPVAQTLELDKVGTGTLSVPLTNYTVKDSPIFVQFSFKKNGRGKPFTRVIALAEPAPATLDAPDKAKIKQSITLKVKQWAALAHDRQGFPPTEIIEDKPDRIADATKQAVKWRVEWTDSKKKKQHKDLDTKGETIAYVVPDDKQGVELTFYAWVGEKFSARAHAKVLVDPAHVHVELSWKDPDGKKHLFPKDVPFTALHDDKTKKVVKVGDKGVLAFDAAPGTQWVTLVFERKESWLATASDGTESLADSKGVQKLVDAGTKVVRLPARFTLLETDWDVQQAPSWSDKDHRFGLRDGDVGSEAKPVPMQLDMHWQFVRFEFFDRFYGAKEHNQKRIGIPPIVLDGFNKAPAGKTPDASSSWTIDTDDATKIAQALPWPIQHKADGTKEDKPDQKSVIQFRTPGGSFVVSESGAKRHIEKIDDKKRLAASAERLKLYDLPAVWRSKNYFARPTGHDGALFEKVAPDVLLESRDKTKPLVFCLDDIVLTDESRRPLSLEKDDAPAVFFHAFSDKGAPDPSQLTPQGLYKSGADTDPAKPKHYSPYSDTTMPNRHTIVDYPDWTRLVIALGSLFDVFADRTHDDGKTDIVGARAAVRFVDLPKSGPPQGSNVTHHAKRTTKDFYAAEPFFTQEYDKSRDFERDPGKYQEWLKPYAADLGWAIGRYDIALLRCCGVDEADPSIELALNLDYFRFHFDFKSEPGDKDDAKKGPVVPLADQPGYRNNVCTNVANRWNSPDDVNSDQTFFEPQDPAVKLRVRSYWFVQTVPNNRAHYLIKPNIRDPNERAFMNAITGSGRLGRTDDRGKPAGDPDPGWFTAAHESGHGSSLPDEYNEKWDAASYEKLSFNDHLPGDPFSQDSPAMMNGNVMPRPRHFWHTAEWIRVATNIPMQVVRGATDKLRLPAHHKNAPYRTYAYTPLRVEIKATAGTRGRFNSFVYLLGDPSVGTDPFRAATVAKKGAEADGMLLVIVKVRFSFPEKPTHAAIDTFLQSFSQGIATKFALKWVVSGDIGGGSPKVPTFHLDRCVIRFSPRFLIDHLDTNDPDLVKANVGEPPKTGVAAWANAKYAAKVKTVEGNWPRHFHVRVQSKLPSNWTGSQELVYQLDPAGNDEVPLGNFFGDMIGLDTSTGGVANEASVKAAIVDKIIKNAVVSPLA